MFNSILRFQFLPSLFLESNFLGRERVSFLFLVVIVFLYFFLCRFLGRKRVFKPLLMFQAHSKYLQTKQKLRVALITNWQFVDFEEIVFVSLT